MFPVTEMFVVGMRAARRVAVLLSALLLGACEAPELDELRFAIPTAPTTLDPRLASDALGSRIGRLLYAQLTDFDAEFRVVPSLANWDRVAADVYRFHLKANRQRFWDGRVLTAADVVATYRFVLDPANASPHRGALSMVESVTAIDETSLEFRLNRPDPLFPAYLNIGIVPADAGRDGLPQGSGPFIYRGADDANQFLLERRDDDQLIRFLAVRDPNMRALKLIKGEVDLLQNEMPPELVDHLDQMDGIEIRRFPGINFSYLGFNMEDPALGQQAIREAVALAIDRDALIEHLWRGGVRPAESILGPDHWAGNRSLQAWPYDPDRARELLAELGYGPDRPLTLTYKTTTNPFRLRIATVLQHQLAEVGIALEIRSYDWGTFFGDIKAGRFQMYSLTWVGIKSPDIFRYVFHSDSIPPNGANRGRYRSATVDSLIENAEAANTLEEQAGGFREAQAIIHRELPYVPFWYEDHFVAFRPGLEGVRVGGDGSYDYLNIIKTNK